MDVLCWWIVFHPPVLLREVRRGEQSWRCLFGHVEAYGLTRDATWVFFDPQGAGCSLRVTHHHDEVVEQIAAARARSMRIIKVEPDGRRYRWPVFPPMNCVTQVASLIGRRAWTPRALMRMLLREGCEVVHEAQSPEGRPGRQGRPAEGAPSGGA